MKRTTTSLVQASIFLRGLGVALVAATAVLLRHAGLAVARRIAWAFDWLES